MKLYIVTHTRAMGAAILEAWHVRGHVVFYVDGLLTSDERTTLVAGFRTAKEMTPNTVAVFIGTVGAMCNAYDLGHVDRIIDATAGLAHEPDLTQAMHRAKLYPHLAAQVTVDDYHRGHLTAGEVGWQLVNSITSSADIEAMVKVLPKTPIGDCESIRQEFLNALANIPLDAEWHSLSSAGTSRLRAESIEAIKAWRAKQ